MVGKKLKSSRLAGNSSTHKSALQDQSKAKSTTKIGQDLSDRAHAKSRSSDNQSVNNGPDLEPLYGVTIHNTTDTVYEQATIIYQELKKGLTLTPNKSFNIDDGINPSTIPSTTLNVDKVEQNFFIPSSNEAPLLQSKLGANTNLPKAPPLEREKIQAKSKIRSGSLQSLAGKSLPANLIDNLVPKLALTLDATGTYINNDHLDNDDDKEFLESYGKFLSLDDVSLSQDLSSSIDVANAKELPALYDDNLSTAWKEAKPSSTNATIARTEKSSASPQSRSKTKLNASSTQKDSVLPSKSRLIRGKTALKKNTQNVVTIEQIMLNRMLASAIDILLRLEFDCFIGIERYAHIKKNDCISSQHKTEDLNASQDKELDQADISTITTDFPLAKLDPKLLASSEQDQILEIVASQDLLGYVNVVQSKSVCATADDYNTQVNEASMDNATNTTNTQSCVQENKLNHGAAHNYQEHRALQVTQVKANAIVQVKDSTLSKEQTLAQIDANIENKTSDLLSFTQEQCVQEDLTQHLRSQPAQASQDKPNHRNLRNGYYERSLNSKYGYLSINQPRARKGVFNSNLIRKKYVASTPLKEDLILSLYTCTSTEQFELVLSQLFDPSVGKDYVHTLADSANDYFNKWRKQKLPKECSFLCIHNLSFVLEEGECEMPGALSPLQIWQVALGIMPNGQHKILSINPLTATPSFTSSVIYKKMLDQALESGAASLPAPFTASLWYNLLNDLANRGLSSPRYVCLDGAIEALPHVVERYPQAHVIFNLIPSDSDERISQALRNINKTQLRSNAIKRKTSEQRLKSASMISDLIHSFS